MKNLAILIGAALLSSSAFAQKNNETSAAIEYLNFEKIVFEGFESNDFNPAKAKLEEAKKFIDLAADNETTKSSPKTLFYKGEIYSAYHLLFSMDSIFAKENGDKYLSISIKSYQNCLDISKTLGKKVLKLYSTDIRLSVEKKKILFGGDANKLYEEGKFELAGQSFELQSKLSQSLYETDTLNLNNASICYEKAKNYKKAAEISEIICNSNPKNPRCFINAANSYAKLENIEKAITITEQGRKLFPNDRDLIMKLVVLYLNSNNIQGAEVALNAAIEASPNDKQLYFNIGTVYMDLKQNEKAEQALTKAIELDPNYNEAVYNLGAHLFNWAQLTKTEAKQLKLGDSRYEEMITKSTEIYKRSLIYLEKYIETDTNNKELLLILFQVHKDLGNTEKAIEFKKRADAIK